MTCEIVKDLLPAYASGECSDETRRVVDEHVKTCASCAGSLRAMTDPTAGENDYRTKEPGIPVGQHDPNRLDEAAKEMTFKKGFRKIRRRWLISIICVLLIIPLTGLGYLGYNETRGEGYAFSNLKGIRNVDSFMKCFQEGDYAGAVEYYDIASMYPELVRDDDIQYDYFYKSEISVVEIGGNRYCNRSLISQSKLEPYREPGTDAPFWAQQIINNANYYENVTTLIPEQVFTEAARIAEESMDGKVVVVDITDETPDSPFTYMRYSAPDGKSYYRPTKAGRLSKVDWLGSNFVPESIFSAYMQEHNGEIDSILAQKQAYRDLGIDRYVEMVKGEYIEEMTNLSYFGMKVKSYSLGKPYRRSESWNPNYYPFESERNKKEYWYVDVMVEFSNENSVNDEVRLIEYNQNFTFKIDGDYLTAEGAIGMMIGPGSVKMPEGVTFFYRILITPDPRVLENDSNRYSFETDGVSINVWITE